MVIKEAFCRIIAALLSTNTNGTRKEWYALTSDAHMFKHQSEHVHT